MDSSDEGCNSSRCGFFSPRFSLGELFKWEMCARAHSLSHSRESGACEKRSLIFTLIQRRERRCLKSDRVSTSRGFRHAPFRMIDTYFFEKYYEHSLTVTGLHQDNQEENHLFFPFTSGRGYLTEHSPVFAALSSASNQSNKCH